MTAFESMLDLPIPSPPRARAGHVEEQFAAAPEAKELPEAVAAEAAFLVNGDSYFSTLAEVLPQARRSLWIIGWDFNPDISLEPGVNDQCLGERLCELADANPELEVNILVWALGPIYSGKSLRLLRRRCFPRHPRIQLRFHMHGDIRGSHHQKIVCIDDRIAFVGGIDLTAKRWDSWHHKPGDELRRAPDGTPYDPLHDVQAMVTGDAARLVGDVARQRWQQATGEVLEPLSDIHDLPEPQLSAARLKGVALSRVPVAVAQTDLIAGRTDGMAVTREVIAKAKRHLYIESQYLASFSIADCLAERLEEPDGPEIVIICTRSSHGVIEKMLMANNRDRIIRRLRRLDRYNRLRVYYPVVPLEQGEQEVLVHTKLLIADSHMLRIGSSNINNRSEAMDTECDLVFRSEDEDHSSAIARLRDRLVAEHLGTDGARITEALASHGSLIRAIDTLNTEPRGLRQFIVEAEGSLSPMPGTDLLDPKPAPAA